LFFAEHFKDDRLYYIPSATEVFLAPRKSFDILALYKSDYYYYDYYNHTHTAVNAVNEQFDGDCQ